MESKYYNKDYIYKTFCSIIQFLPLNQKREFRLLLLGMIFLAFIETFTAGVIAFFASFIANPNNAIHSKYILYMSEIFGFDLINNTVSLVVGICFIVIIAIVMRNLLQVLITFYTAYYGARAGSLISIKILTGFLYNPYEWHLSKKSSDLILAMQWRQNLNVFFVSCLKVTNDFLIITALIVFIFILKPVISSIVLIIIACFTSLIFRFFKRHLDNTSKKVKNYLVLINRLVHQSLIGIKDIKIFCREGSFLHSFNQFTKVEARQRAVQQTLAQLPRWMLEVGAFILLSVAVCIFYIFVKSSSVQATATVSLLAVVAWRVLPAISRVLNSLSQVRIHLPFVNNYLKYLNEIQSDQFELPGLPVKSANFIFKREICVENLFFRYLGAKKYTLKNLTFIIKKGEAIGVIGSSGAGKSTLADILIGLLKPSDGFFKIDGEELDNKKIRAWRQHIGYVTQTPYIFNGTLAENIAFGVPFQEIDRENVLECCRIASVNNFLSDLPNGIDTPIGERGVNLSGGQNQRVAIARTLYNKPEVMVFDEATSFLDTQNEREILDTVFSLKKKKTLIVIAHRLSIIEECNTILWLENGEVKKTGTPDEILPEYRNFMSLTRDHNRPSLKESLC